MFVRHAHPRKSQVLNIRLAPATVAMIDTLADEQAESRSATLRLIVRAGLTALGVARS